MGGVVLFGFLGGVVIPNCTGVDTVSIPLTKTRQIIVTYKLLYLH